MKGLEEIRTDNERATDVEFLRGRIQKAFDYLVNARTKDEASVLAAMLTLASALEGRTIEEEGTEQ